MRIGIACDHGGFPLKESLMAALAEAGHEVSDFGAESLNTDDDYPDYVIPLAQAVANGDMERGIALCGSGVGACIAANKVSGVRAAVLFEAFSARQGVEDDDLNFACLGARVIGPSYAIQLIDTFLAARFSGAERHQRRLRKVAALESGTPPY